MRKNFLYAFNIVITVLLLVGCGINKVPDENTLKEMLITKHPECLQRYIYQDEVFEVDDFEILRRQTNKEEKTDKVDCKLTVHNEYYEGVFNYTLHLNYYDEGGWQLDALEHYGTDEITAKSNTLPAEIIENEVSYYNDFYGELTFLEDHYDNKSGIITRKYVADNNFKHLTTNGELIIEYKLCEENYEGNFGYYSWIPTYSDNIKQEWNFNSKYKFDAKPQKYWSGRDFNDQVPKILGADGAGDDIADGIAKGIAYIEVKDITSEKIEIIVDVINRKYSGVSRFDSFSQKNITFNIKDHVYSQRVFSNRDGDYINLVLDPEKGIYIEEYRYDSNNKYYYDYIPY